MLKRPTKTGLSFSSAGYIPPRSYHGLKKARHPIGLMTFRISCTCWKYSLLRYMRQPVRIHGLGGTLHTSLKNILTALSRTMKIFVIEEYDLREQYRFLVSGFYPVLPDELQEGNRTHLLKLLSSKTKCHCNKRIISSGRTYGIQLVLNSLPSLVIIPADLIKGILDRSFLWPLQLSSEYFRNSLIYLS